MSMTLKACSASALKYIILRSRKTIKLVLTFTIIINFRVPNKKFSRSLVYQRVTIHYSVFLKHFEILTGSFISFRSYTFSSITSPFRSSYKHFIHTGLSTSKIMSLYLIMVSLMAFSSLSLETRFRRGIFYSFDSFSSFDNVPIYRYIVEVIP